MESYDILEAHRVPRNHREKSRSGAWSTASTVSAYHFNQGFAEAPQADCSSAPELLERSPTYKPQSPQLGQ